MSLEIIGLVKDSTLTIQIIGLMDYSTIDGFQPDIPSGITKVIVDFSHLDFIDSTGIGAVLLILYESSERGIMVEFDALNEMVTELFNTVGVFQIRDSLIKEGR